MPRDRVRRPTSADVARAAGVSRATVSYVLNDTPHQKIPDATRRRVFDAAAALGYTPSAAARALRSGRSDIVLMLVPDWPLGDNASRFTDELSAKLAAAGLTLVSHPIAHRVRPVAELWKTITPACVIDFGALGEADVAAIRAAGIALTVIMLGPDTPRGREPATQQQRQGSMQVAYLAAAGHRSLGYAWPADERLSPFATPRLDGARFRCAELGLPDPEVRTVPLDAAAAAAAVTAWRASGVTAVCAYNDEVAIAVLAGLRRCGLSAPADLAVIGVDDIPVAAMVDPPLTTIVNDAPAAARHLTARIVAGLDGDPGPEPPTPETLSVIRRESA